MASLFATFLRRCGTRRRAVQLRVPMLGKPGRALRDGALCDPAATTPGITFDEWLDRF